MMEQNYQDSVVVVDAAAADLQCWKQCIRGLLDSVQGQGRHEARSRRHYISPGRGKDDAREQKSQLEMPSNCRGAQLSPSSSSSSFLIAQFTLQYMPAITKHTHTHNCKLLGFLVRWNFEKIK